MMRLHDKSDDDMPLQFTWQMTSHITPTLMAATGKLLEEILGPNPNAKRQSRKEAVLKKEPAECRAEGPLMFPMCFVEKRRVYAARPDLLDRFHFDVEEDEKKKKTKVKVGENATDLEKLYLFLRRSKRFDAFHPRYLPLSRLLEAWTKNYDENEPLPTADQCAVELSTVMSHTFFEKYQYLAQNGYPESKIWWILYFDVCTQQEWEFGDIPLLPRLDVFVKFAINLWDAAVTTMESRAAKAVGRCLDLTEKDVKIMRDLSGCFTDRRNTYDKETTREALSKFDARTFTGPNVSRMMSMIRLSIHYVDDKVKEPVPPELVSRCISATVSAYSSGISFDAEIERGTLAGYANKTTLKRFKCVLDGKTSVGSDILATIQLAWIRYVRRPIVEFIAYVVHPRRATLLPNGCEWAKSPVPRGSFRTLSEDQAKKAEEKTITSLQKSLTHQNILGSVVLQDPDESTAVHGAYIGLMREIAKVQPNKVELKNFLKATEPHAQTALLHAVTEHMKRRALCMDEEATDQLQRGMLQAVGLNPRALVQLKEEPAPKRTRLAEPPKLALTYEGDPTPPAVLVEAPKEELHFDVDALLASVAAAAPPPPVLQSVNQFYTAFGGRGVLRDDDFFDVSNDIARTVGVHPLTHQSRVAELFAEAYKMCKHSPAILDNFVKSYLWTVEDTASMKDQRIPLLHMDNRYHFKEVDPRSPRVFVLEVLKIAMKERLRIPFDVVKPLTVRK